ncbi:hypothetical protein GGI25_000216 [Coemansia spiralis]|uniref:G-protein coupled receptors family 3 profile domain-containing protein n=2 Tax=Coemansia TaxID=4863 RepID=A0A9W8GC69_9FUNG|nr:hypothetical protein EDC05_000569 [Coemansia umbellata]KAJ2625789.1 hypothetical protein GGI26_000250 [Coemansia sp. RSA 1358]KAJ2680912.1 hypothetical protein GGI25_000216 [Coemansia spiralis]
MAVETKSGGGVAILIICSLLLAINFVCLAYCYWKRNYLPLKACNMPNMTLTYVAMLMSFVGSANIASFSSTSKNWSVCAVTLGWLGMSLGIFAFIALFQMRVYTYLNVFVWMRRAMGIYFIVPVLYMVLLSVIYAVVAFVLPPNIGFEYVTSTNTCLTHDPLYFVGMAFILIQSIILCVLLVKTRKMNSCFNEHRVSLINFCVCIVAGIILLALGRVDFGDNQLALSGILKILFVVIPQQVYFYVTLAPTVYHMVMHGEEYQNQFVTAIREKGLSQVYEMACKCPLGEISNIVVGEKARGVSMDGSVYSDSSNFSGNVPGPVANNSIPHAENEHYAPNAMPSYHAI